YCQYNLAAFVYLISRLRRQLLLKEKLNPLFNLYHIIVMAEGDRSLQLIFPYFPKNLAFSVNPLYNRRVVFSEKEKMEDLLCLTKSKQMRQPIPALSVCWASA
ncbi:MAG: hypothetical protein J6S18_04020, partial [Oscillospiraceae bacterium]|nr:hypothetical protein [Oscillospiraceae bacterium]